METESGIFSSGVLLDLQRKETENGIFSSGVLLDVQVGWKQKVEYFPLRCSFGSQPTGISKWNIFLRCSLGSTSQMETENRIFSPGVLLDLQARWKQKIEYFPLVFCWIYKPDGNRKWNIFLRCSFGSTSRLETKNRIFFSCVLLDLQAR